MDLSNEFSLQGSSSDPARSGTASDPALRETLPGLPGPAATNDYAAFLHDLKSAVALRDDAVLTTIATLTYHPGGQPRSYEMVKISSAVIESTDPIFVIRAGIHGNEPAGSLTVARKINEIFDYAHTRGVKLVIYPLDNPSGFEFGLRYNADNHRGSGGNNDCLRYELADGTLGGDLGDGRDPLTGRDFAIRGIRWSNDPALGLDLPQETRASLADLGKLPIRQVAALLDMHADNYLRGPLAYQFLCGERGCFEEIARRVAAQCPMLAGSGVEDHPARPADYEKEVFKVLDDPARPFMQQADELGFVRHVDGTMPELFYRLGSPFCITTEVSGETPQTLADTVHMTWMLGMIDLSAQMRSRMRIAPADA